MNRKVRNFVFSLYLDSLFDDPMQYLANTGDLQGALNMAHDMHRSGTLNNPGNQAPVDPAMVNI